MVPRPISRPAARAAVALAAVALACVAGGPAQAAPAADPVRLRLSPHPAAVIWRGEAPGAICVVGRTLQVSTAPVAARSGTFRRRSELVAEIIAPPPLAARVTRIAAACAEAAAPMGPDLAATQAFGARLAACLRAEQAADFVGKLTLWIDGGCDL